MDAQYVARYRELYERHWWWRARERLILDVLRARRPAGGWRTILDVGCGDGLFFGALAQLGGVELVEGVEPAEALISRDGPHACRIHVVPFDASFDPGRRYSLLLMLDVLEHLPDPVAALRHALTLLEPDGMLLATVPAFVALWTRHDELNHHYTRYDKRSFRELAHAAGLRVDDARYFFHWTAMAKLGERLVEAIVPGPPSPPRLPPRLLNAALYALSRFEQRLTGAFPLPFGSSLLVVGGRGDGPPRRRMARAGDGEVLAGVRQCVTSL
jgi:2-polyprenyl-3-methyl-5-hydroxy-6-metoxy-1,4-benzoquinol methylase